MTTTTDIAGAPDRDAAWADAHRCLDGGLLSVLMPAYRLGAVIAGNIVQVHATLAGRIPFEIVVVDDGSPDDTAARAAEAAARLPGVRLVRQPRNMGKGAALRRGFAAARGTHILLLDADLDLPPAQVAGFFTVMARTGADAVIGSKRHPDSRLHYPAARRLMSTIYYTLVKALVGLPLRDTQTGIKLFRRPVLEWVFPRMLVKQFAFDLEMLAIAHGRGFRIAEAPVVLDFHGRWGTIRPRAVARIVTDTLAVFYRLRLLRYYDSIPDLRRPEPAPRVSVIIACPAASAYLDECLAGLAEQTQPPFETLILPDRPSGRVWPAGVHEIPTGPLRPSEKRNLGLARARGDIVAFLDDDTIPLPDWLEAALPHFGDPGVAGVGGPAETPERDPYLARLSGAVYAHRLVSAGYIYRYVPTRLRDTDDFPSCNLLIRTGVMRRAGGFITEFWPGEDTHLCHEIVTRMRLRLVYDPRVHVLHHRRRLFRPHLRQVSRYALHRGYFAKRFPATSRRVGYMMPAALLLGTVLGAPAALALPALRPVYLGVLACYAALTGLGALRLNPLSWLLVWLGIIATHYTYGFWFLRGVLARRMPGEKQRFDHPSEKPDQGASNTIGGADVASAGSAR